jgi:hypothetical protein
MIAKIKLTVILLCSIVSNAVGQSNFNFKSTTNFSSFKRMEFKKFSDDFLKLSFLNQTLYEKTSSSSERKILKPIEPFKYKAFFCRIEQQMCNRFSIWIKVRVGDESNYHRSKAIQ